MKIKSFTDFFKESVTEEPGDSWLTTKSGHRILVDRDGKTKTTLGGSLSRGTVLDDANVIKKRDGISAFLDRYLDKEGESDRQNRNKTAKKHYIELEDHLVDSYKENDKLKFDLNRDTRNYNNVEKREYKQKIQALHDTLVDNREKLKKHLDDMVEAGTLKKDGILDILKNYDNKTKETIEKTKEKLRNI